MNKPFPTAPTAAGTEITRSDVMSEVTTVLYQQDRPTGHKLQLIATTYFVMPPMKGVAERRPSVMFRVRVLNRDTTTDYQSGSWFDINPALEWFNKMADSRPFSHPATTDQNASVRAFPIVAGERPKYEVTDILRSTIEVAQLVEQVLDNGIATSINLWDNRGGDGTIVVKTTY